MPDHIHNSIASHALIEFLPDHLRRITMHIIFNADVLVIVLEIDSPNLAVRAVDELV